MGHSHRKPGTRRRAPFALRAAAVARVAAVAGSCALAACGGQADRPELLIGAASDLALAMPELVAGFEAAHDVRVRVTLGSSGQIAQQIIQGAPVDVFLSADQSWVDRLAEAGRVTADGRAPYARGLLALVTVRGRKPFLTLEELAGADVRRIAIANPEHAPYGRAARQALVSAGVNDAVADRIIFAENVRQTLQFIDGGNVDAAIAALSLVNSDSPPWAQIPDTLHEPLLQVAAVITGRPNEAAAAAFLRYMTGDSARAILARHHFLPAEPEP
jgi:molybdate transport system substrate-binding protein